MKNLKVVFMGTPVFAVGILEAILDAGYEVPAVVTVADKPAGRGQKTAISDVKKFATEKNIPVLQPEKLKSEEFLSELQSFQADVFVVVAFRMLPKEVWAMPKFGTFNLHASLLPQYRGAAPINWALINGDTKTGVTTFFIDDKIDTGAIIESDEIALDENILAGELHDKLIQLGAQTVVRTLGKLENGEITTYIQQESESLKPAPKLNKENTKIDWQKSGREIHNLIRGLSPYPSAWSICKDGDQEWNIKILESRFSSTEKSRNVGSIRSERKSLFVQVKDGELEILQLQFPGKKKMKIHEFLNGFSFSEDAIMC